MGTDKSFYIYTLGIQIEGNGEKWDSRTIEELDKFVPALAEFIKKYNQDHGTDFDHETSFDANWHDAKELEEN